MKRILLPTLLLVLAYGFWVSPTLKAISAGVAIFLFGMISLEEGFRSFSGGYLQRILRRSTASMSRSLLFGIFSTTVTQSSSLVSVITISFLSTGLITLTAGIGIIYGANLGTTTGAWLIAGFGLKVDIAAYAMPMLVFGVILLFQSSKSLKGLGYILAGLGFLFLGIHYMKEGFETFKEGIDLSRFAVAGYPGVLLFTLIGILATVVMQSSHATMVLVITALAAGQVTYENALALAIGANVGTTITAVLGSIGANPAGKRLAGAHLIFNLATGLIAIALVFQLVKIVDSLSGLIGIAPDEFTLKLAVFHSIFNLLGIALMMPFTPLLVKKLEQFLPEKAPEVDQPQYLNKPSAEFPGTAAEAVRLETTRVYDAGLRIILAGIGLQRSDVLSTGDLRQTVTAQTRIHTFDIDAMYARHIKGIYSAIIAFISETVFSRQEEQSANLQWLREACKLIVEAIKDTKHMQKNLRFYLESDNAEMREAYNTIRVQIATVIRQLETLRTEGKGAVDVLSLDGIKLTVDEDQTRLNNTITMLIGRRAITPAMGSSLMNDTAYAQDISLALIQAAQTLFASNQHDLTQAARDVLLDHREVHDLAENQSRESKPN